MENLINQENLENIKETIENKITNVSANHILCAGAGALILSSGLKLLGSYPAGSLIAKLSIPLVAIGLYKKYKEYSQSASESESEYPESETYAGNA
jgi:hypothetical protein